MAASSDVDPNAFLPGVEATYCVLTLKSDGLNEPTQGVTALLLLGELAFQFDS